MGAPRIHTREGRANRIGRAQPHATHSQRHTLPQAAHDYRITTWMRVRTILFAGEWSLGGAVFTALVIATALIGILCVGAK